MKKSIILTVIALTLIAVFFHVFVFRFDANKNQIVVGTPAQVEASGFDPVAFGLPETAKEVVSQRTYKTATFILEDGKYAQTAYGDKKLVTQDRFGNIVPVSEKGEVIGREYVFDKLPDQARIMFNLDKPEYTFFKDGYWFKIAFRGNAKGFVVEDNVIQYTLGENAYLRWSVVGANVIKEIIIEREGELPDLSFALEHSSNLGLANSGGVLQLFNPKGELIFDTQEPFLTDMDREKLPTPVKIVEKNKRFYYEYKKEGLEFPYIIDPSAGANSPGTLADSNITGCTSSISWSNASNAASSDNSYAAVSAAFTESEVSTRCLLTTNFGFSIPGGSTIDGVLVEYERKCSGNSAFFHCTDGTIKLYSGGALVGSNKAYYTGNSSSYWPTSDAYYSYGGASDLWGASLDVSTVNNSGFGVASSPLVRDGAP